MRIYSEERIKSNSVAGPRQQNLINVNSNHPHSHLHNHTNYNHYDHHHLHKQSNDGFLGVSLRTSRSLSSQSTSSSYSTSSSSSSSSSSSPSSIGPNCSIVGDSLVSSPTSTTTTTTITTSSTISSSTSRKSSSLWLDQNKSNNSIMISPIKIPMLFTNQRNKQTISMYKFINSKGKQHTRETNGIGNGYHNHHHHNHDHVTSNGTIRGRKNFQNNLVNDSVANGVGYVDDDYVLKPPRYVTSNHNFYKKRISAIDKIQEELKEMKLREDELRSLRIRGLSYPNLNSICDEDFTSDDQTIASSSEENKDSFHSRYSSNPDLLQHPLGTLDIDVSSTSSSSSPPSTSSTENDNHPTQSNGNTSSLSSMHNLDEPLKIDEIDCGLKIGGPRRKIPLIAIWEQKIQEKQIKTITTTITTITTTMTATKTATMTTSTRNGNSD
ncbi:hypothetical protein NH340_JMT03847 [Sarcoptes scabiei]|nr:hypothetical protein NH340_JMT03847 [Sarcoptes scabiei]